MISDNIKDISEICIEMSVKAVGNESYAYAFGYFVGQMEQLFNDLKLTPEQQKIVLEYQISLYKHVR